MHNNLSNKKTQPLIPRHRALHIESFLCASASDLKCMLSDHDEAVNNIVTHYHKLFLNDFFVLFTVCSRSSPNNLSAAVEEKNEECHWLIIGMHLITQERFCLVWFLSIVCYYYCSIMFYNRLNFG